MAAGGASGPAEGAEESAVCARRLARVLVFGETAPSAGACAGDPEALSVLAVRGAAAADGEGGEWVARRTVAACRQAARWQEALAERGVRALPLGGVAHIGSLYPDPGGRLVVRAGLLVSPYDAARVRLILAAGGLESAGDVTAHGLAFRSGGPPLVLRWALHPPGWGALPLSPFLAETVTGEPPCPSELMGPAASWAAHRLILASGLWRPGTWTPLELAESAALGTRVAEEDRRRWTVMVRRWGAGRLWRRADEVESWLLGAPAPHWLREVFERTRRRPGLRECLSLQDTPARAGLFLLRGALLRLKR